MVRTQMYLTARQHRALRKQAREQGVSMTELLRRILDEHFAERRGLRRFSKDLVHAFFDLGGESPDERTDVSERHDDVLADALRARPPG
jgi:hypothetical protein